MSDVLPPANWYVDPAGTGGLRYWDGTQWTGHRAPPPPPPAYFPPQGWTPPWKGAQLGLPAAGPGALADPGRRLAAHLLDDLVMLPVAGVVVGVTMAIAAPHFGPIFPTVTNNGTTTSSPAPGVLWLDLTLFACLAFVSLLMVLYQSVATARYGRTLGKRWLGIRPLTLDGHRPGWGRAFGRASIAWVFGLLSWIGIIDPLFCLWEENRQCLHDKVAGTVVVNDRRPGDPAPGLAAAPLGA